MRFVTSKDSIVNKNKKKEKQLKTETDLDDNVWVDSPEDGSEATDPDQGFDPYWKIVDDK